MQRIYATQHGHCSASSRNRARCKQVGQIIETRTAFFGRYYTSDTCDNGRRKAKTVKLADKSDIYRSKADVQHLLNRLMEAVNTFKDFPSAQLTLTDFIEKHYLPWCKDAQKSAATVNGYKRIWECYWQKHVGKIPLTDLRTSDATAVLDHHAKAGPGRNTLSHIKFMLSGVYEWAIATGVLPLNANPIRSAVKGQGAKWTVKVSKPRKTTKYSLETIIAMLRVLEPLDLRAAVAVALAYFAALRPAEIRGLRWEDYDGTRLDIKRGVWRNIVGETKTEGSAASVPVIEPPRSLLEKLRGESTDGFILQNAAGKPLSLDSLNVRVIAPALKKAGLDWRGGYYPGRRGISSLVTDTSKNALNSTGLLRHSTPVTALKHYTTADEKSVGTAMKDVEAMALDLMAKSETVQ
jgi:integrase